MTGPAPQFTPRRPAPTLPNGLTPIPEVNGGWNVFRGDHRIGQASPYVAGDIRGRWFGKRQQEPARPFEPHPSDRYTPEVLALAHVCRCQPHEIRTTDASPIEER